MCESPPFWLRLSFAGFVESSPSLVVSFFLSLFEIRHLGCVFLSESPPILVASFSLSSFGKSTIVGCVFLSSYLRVRFINDVDATPALTTTHHRLSHNSLAEFIASWHKHKPRLSLPSKKKKRLSSPNWIRSPTLCVLRDSEPAEERYIPNPERN